MAEQFDVVEAVCSLIESVDLRDETSKDEFAQKVSDNLQVYLIATGYLTGFGPHGPQSIAQVAAMMIEPMQKDGRWETLMGLLPELLAQRAVGEA
jgi:hypothetical protein